MIEHVLKSSLERGIVITIMYVSGNNITRRNIRVLELHGDNVLAYCYMRRQPRVFKVKNILAADFIRQRV